MIEAAVVAGAGLIVALVVVVAIGVVARQLVREAASLAAVARYLADEQLPQDRGAAARRGGGRGRAAQARWRGPPGSARIRGRHERAEPSCRRTAVPAATAEARLRGGFRQVLTSLGRRNQSLLHRQLRIIDTLEQQAASPAALADLFALDHLTTRMRRHAESLTVLSGAPAPRPRHRPGRGHRRDPRGRGGDRGLQAGRPSAPSPRTSWPPRRSTT